jgi:hypothetical protein
MDAECNHEKGLLYNSLIINCLQDTSPALDRDWISRGSTAQARFLSYCSTTLSRGSTPIPRRFLFVPLACRQGFSPFHWQFFSRFHSLAHISNFLALSKSGRNAVEDASSFFLVIPLPAHLEWNHEKSATLLVGRSTSLFIQGMVKARAVWIANCATRSKANASGEWNNEKRRGIQAVRWPKD